MSNYIPNNLRSIVAERAGYVCEYCLISQEDSFHACHIDHIISIKHGGQTEEENLAFACQFCNRNKGADIGSVILPSKEFIRFFNPRVDHWDDHFDLDNGKILPKTEIEQVTVKILDFNNPEALIDRQLLIKAGRYPPAGKPPKQE